MRRKRNAKIIATLGPASSDRATIQALFEAGADVFRHCAAAEAQGLAGKGDIIAIAAGMPFGAPGTTNLLRIARLECAPSSDGR